MSELPNMFLVTGATGWVGQRLVEYLHNGIWEQLPRRACVRCLVAPRMETTALRALGSRVEIVEGDLLDPESSMQLCRNATNAILIHTAGIIHPRRVREFYEVNVQGTSSLLAAAVSAGIRRAVIVSSNSPFGCNPYREHVFDEQSPYHPYRGYGQSKMLMEMRVLEAQKAGKIETVIVRPPWFYGPWQPPRQTQFFTMIRTGKMPILGSGENRRSMVYIDNLCQGLARAALIPRAAGQTYWIADARPYTMNEIVDTVERLMEQEFHLQVAHRRIKLPALTGGVASVVDGLLQAAGIYQQKIHVLSEMNKTIACTTAKAERELEFRPEVALEEGMRRSIAWCLSKGIQI